MKKWRNNQMETCATDSLKKVKILNWFDSFRGMVLREEKT